MALFTVATGGAALAELGFVALAIIESEPEAEFAVTGVAGAAVTSADCKLPLAALAIAGEAAFWTLAVACFALPVDAPEREGCGFLGCLPFLFFLPPDFFD